MTPALIAVLNDSNNQNYHITLSFSPDLFRAQIGGNLLLAQEQRVGYTSATRLTQTDHASFIAVIRLLYLEYMSSCLLLYMVPQ